MKDFYVNVEDIEFENDGLNSYIKDLKTCFSDGQKNFAKICCAIYNIWLYCADSPVKAKSNILYDAYKLLELYGFNRKSVERHCRCYGMFVNSYNCLLLDEFKDFSPSKLYEMLPYSKSVLLQLIDQKYIIPSMTCKELRDKLKVYNNSSNDNIVVNEEEIPMAFDPKKEYSFDYYCGLSKNELINCCMDLQNYIQKKKG